MGFYKKTKQIFFFFFSLGKKIFKEKQDLGFTFLEFCFSKAFIRNISDCHAYLNVCARWSLLITVDIHYIHFYLFQLCIV